MAVFTTQELAERFIATEGLTKLAPARLATLAKFVDALEKLAKTNFNLVGFNPGPDGSLFRVMPIEQLLEALKQTLEEEEMNGHAE